MWRHKVSACPSMYSYISHWIPLNPSNGQERAACQWVNPPRTRPVTAEAYAQGGTGKNPSVPSVNPLKRGTVWNPSTEQLHICKTCGALISYYLNSCKFQLNFLHTPLLILTPRKFRLALDMCWTNAVTKWLNRVFKSIMILTHHTAVRASSSCQALCSTCLIPFWCMKFRRPSRP